MTLYVDIAPVRIQQYLARTPRLRETAGASAQLAAATAEESLRHCLQGRGEINTEAGEADGVVNLIVYGQDEADHVIDAVLVVLRAALPGAWFQAVTAEAPDYVRAVAAMHKARQAGQVRDDLPARSEFPFAAPCRLCRTDPAVTRVRLGDGDSRDACADCQARHSGPVRTEGARARSRLATEMGRPVPETFERLAALGGERRGRNHLATVYADGNAIGDFFSRLAERDLPAGGHGEVSKRLSAATRDALTEATLTVASDDDSYLCVVPHVVGGDDLLASLPADRAWPFVRAFLGDLGTRLAALAADHGLGKEHGLAVPSVSAGVVIARDTHPFHMVSDLAYDCLKEAKRHVAGQEASLQVHDVTFGGAGAPLRLTDLEAAAEDLDRLTALGQSGRSALGEALASGGTGRAATVARRLGRDATLAPFLTDEAPIDLAHALRIARWWQ